AGADREEVGPEAIEVGIDLGLARGGDAEHGDHGGDADGDAESGEDDAQGPGTEARATDPADVSRREPRRAQPAGSRWPGHRPGTPSGSAGPGDGTADSCPGLGGSLAWGVGPVTPPEAPR